MFVIYFLPFFFSCILRLDILTLKDKKTKEVNSPEKKTKKLVSNEGIRLCISKGIKLETTTKNMIMFIEETSSCFFLKIIKISAVHLPTYTYY